jgi:hypothetical protein
MNNKHYLTVDNGRVRINSRLIKAMARIDEDRDEISRKRHLHPTGYGYEYLYKAHSPIAEQKSKL